MFDKSFQWHPESWWQWYDGQKRVEKRMRRIRRKLNALYTIVSNRQKSFIGVSWRVIAALKDAMREKKIESLARKSAKQIKLRLKRLATMVEKYAARKPNGTLPAPLKSFALPSDDPDYDMAWEWEIRYDWLMQRDSMADGEDGVLDEEAIAPHLPQRKRDSVALKRDRAKSSKWGCESLRPHRSWKSRRRIKWRVLGNPSTAVLS